MREEINKQVIDLSQATLSRKYDPHEFFHHGSRAKKIPDPGSASKNLSIFNPKIVSKLSEI
jgi:hypothetical protein